eukprot:gene29174-24137_t
MGYVSVRLTAVPPGGNGTDGARAGAGAVSWSGLVAEGGGAPPAAYGSGNPRGGWGGGALAVYSGGRAPREGMREEGNKREGGQRRRRAAGASAREARGVSGDGAE